MDFDLPIQEKASELGQRLAEDGPEALFDEIENLLPAAWREQVVAFPLAAVIAGLGVGIFLGMKKSDEVIAAGTSMITAAAMSNISSVMDAIGGGKR